MKREEEARLIELCGHLLKIPSMSGEENLLVDKLKSVFEEIGFDDIYVDEYGSITARLIGNKPGPRILFDAHMDTVPVKDAAKWKHDPFGGEIEDGRIYGRGASDMKGALSSMIAAAENFLNEHGRDFCGEVCIAGVVHEECFEGVAARKISARVKPDLVIIGEASNLKLNHGQRGRAEIVAETFGKSSHSSNPDKGINAVHKMLKLVKEISSLECFSHEVLGKGILELTDIISSPYPGASVVPDYCRVTYDRRLLTGETAQQVLEPLQGLIDRLKAEDPDFAASVSFSSGEEKCFTGNTIQGERFFPAWLYDPGEDFVQRAWGALKEIGLSPELSHYSFCTNGSHYAGEAGIKTLGFGPSYEHLAHIADEYVEIHQLQKACQGYKKIMEEFLTKEKFNGIGEEK